MFEYFPLDSEPGEFALGVCGDFSDFIALWQSKRNGKQLPGRADFTLQDFLGWHSRMAISEILPSGDDLKFLIFGSEMVEQQGDDLTGCILSERLPEAYRYVYQPHIKRIVRSPSFALGKVQSASDSDKSMYVTVMHLPVASDGVTVDGMLHLTWQITANPSFPGTATQAAAQ